jgi:hypothetical protein
MAAIGASYILTLYGEKINPEVEPHCFLGLGDGIMDVTTNRHFREERPDEEGYFNRNMLIFDHYIRFMRS